jgi:hypothetical protein
MGKFSETMVVTAGLVLLTWSAPAGAVDVPYISGGAGLDAREELRGREMEYNLKIIAAEKSGDYLADVEVVIQSGREQVLVTTMEGPFLLVKLPPGTYTVSAAFGGQTLKQTVSVSDRGRREVFFRLADTSEGSALR